MSTLERYLTDKGYRPTQREIAADTGLSLGVVNAQMQQLRRQGFPLAQ
jgi:biotin operon repressor